VVCAGADANEGAETGGFAVEAAEVLGSEFFEHGFWVFRS